MMRNSHSVWKTKPTRLIVACAIAIFSPVMVASAQTRAIAGPRPTNSRQPPVTQSGSEIDDNLAARTQLNRRLPEINFNGIALADAVDFLRDITGANISVDWKVLKAAGIERETPVTAKLRDIKFSKALNLILADASGGPTKLTYTVDQGVIQIFATRDLPITLATYDVSALLAAHPSYASELTSKVMDNIGPSSWEEKGGTQGMIKLDGNKLYVAQTQEGQKEVSYLLDHLKNTTREQVEDRK